MPDERKEWRTHASLIDSLAVGLVALGVAAVALRLWEADLGVPFVYVAPDRSPLVYAPDAPFYLMMVKGAIDHGWFLSNPSLGWPFGQHLHDLPHGLDNLNLAVLQVLGWVFGDAFVTVNVFYLLTFVGVAVAAYLVARRLGTSRVAGAAVAVLYAFLPYHFARGTAHLLLSAYWLVPVGALLLAAVVSPDPPFTAARPDGGWRVALRSRSAALWLLGCAGLASTGAYYAAITLTLLVPLVVVDFVARRRTRVLASGGIAAAAILAVAMLNLVPTFVYWAEHGRNTDLVRRGPSETEVNGLKISQLVLPTEGHRIDALGEVQADSTRFSVINAERGQQLGFLGAAGFLALLGTVLVAARRRDLVHAGPVPAPVDREARPAPVAGPGDVMRAFGVATVVAVLVGAVSGFSLIVAGLGGSEIRSWNRVSIFIGYFALVTVAFGIDWCRRRLPDRRWRNPVVLLGVGLLVVAGLLDQVSPRVTPEYRAQQRRFASDAAFFRRVERTLPRGSAVFNLPYVFFPEPGITANVGPYDNARGYLQTDTLKWSWGGVLGTEADWAAGAAQSPTKEMLDRLVAVGFRGLVFDRRGYPEGPFREFGLIDALGLPRFESDDGTLAYYDLREYKRSALARLGRKGFRAKRLEAFRDHGLPKQRG